MDFLTPSGDLAKLTEAKRRAAQIVGSNTVLKNLRRQSTPFEVGPPGAGLQNVRKHVLSNLLFSPNFPPPRFECGVLVMA